MNIGFIGLGRMGGNMVERLLRGGHRVWAYTTHAEAAARLAAAGGSQIRCRRWPRLCPSRAPSG
jgi:6-phosphogluconate dehydrogenase